MKNAENLLLINPLEDISKIKALASEPRINILNLLKKNALNVNEIAEKLNLPQSTVATHISILENAGLIKCQSQKAKKGSQKICTCAFTEILIQFPPPEKTEKDFIEVEMPIGIFTDFEVSSPCGLCSSEKIIGFLDMSDSFLSPERIKAGLLWCGSGFFEYKFPNNAKNTARIPKKIEFSMELCSEVPGTNENWQSDITFWVNNIEIGTWTSPGDFGDKRGIFTPTWWKLEGSQYGLLKHWSVNDEGSFVDGVKISNITLGDLELAKHHSIKMKIGVKENAQNVGGMNIFGRGFGNYEQGIILRMFF